MVANLYKIKVMVRYIFDWLHSVYLKTVSVSEHKAKARGGKLFVLYRGGKLSDEHKFCEIKDMFFTDMVCFVYISHF